MLNSFESIVCGIDYRIQIFKLKDIKYINGSDTRNVGPIANLQVVWRSQGNLELGILYVFKMFKYYKYRMFCMHI